MASSARSGLQALLQSSDVDLLQALQGVNRRDRSRLQAMLAMLTLADAGRDLGYAFVDNSLRGVTEAVELALLRADPQESQADTGVDSGSRPGSPGPLSSSPWEA